MRTVAWTVRTVVMTIMNMMMMMMMVMVAMGHEENGCVPFTSPQLVLAEG